MPAASLTGNTTPVRFIRFLTVGGTAYVVQWLAMKLTVSWLPTYVAFVFSWACSTATHYTMNRFWALPSARNDSWRQFREYLGTAALSLIIQTLLFSVCVDGFGLGKLWATAVAVPPSTVVVFLLLNYRVFKARAASGENAK